MLLTRELPELVEWDFNENNMVDLLLANMLYFIGDIYIEKNTSICLLNENSFFNAFFFLKFK